MNTREITAPEWYVEAKKAGASDATLKEQVKNFCLAALKRKASSGHGAEPTEVPAKIVDLTFAMYEYALQAGKGEA